MRATLGVLLLSATAAAGSALDAAAPPQAPAQLLAPGVPYPQGLQGHDDENWPTRLVHDQAALAARYKALGAMQPGIRRYNMFWSAFESVKSAAEPMACPAGTEPHPSSSGGDRQGFHRYHCYHSAQLQQFDLIFEKVGPLSAGRRSRRSHRARRLPRALCRDA